MVAPKASFSLAPGPVHRAAVRPLLAGVLAAGCLLLAGAGVGRAEEPAAEPAGPPQVDHTDPTFWSREVDADLRQIEVGFDQPVRTGPINQSDALALLPTITGAARAAEDNTEFTVPVRLEPGRVYVLPVSAGRGGVTGSYLVFQTGGEARPENAPPQVVDVEIRQLPLPAAPAATTAPAPAAAPTAAAATAQTLVRVTFDRDMNPRTHGFVVTQNDEPLPVADQQVVYDRRTRSWQVAFSARPGIVTLQLNSETNVGFRSADPARVPAWPVQLSFQVPFQGSLHQTSRNPEEPGD